MKKGDRVEVAVWTDSWMRGDRYGIIVSPRPYNRYVGDPDIPTSLVRVKMDKSNRVLRFAVGNLIVISEATVNVHSCYEGHNCG